MELHNEFTVRTPVEEAWRILTDLERIAPCMPGARLTEVEGDDYRGSVKVKVGPITAEYRGVARFLEQDEEARRAVLRAEGRDTRGQGNANATITATLVAEGSATKVTVETDLAITGRVAQFGRGVLADVSGKLLGQFVDCLERTVLVGPAAPADAVVAGAGTDPVGDAVAPGTTGESGTEGTAPGEADGSAAAAGAKRAAASRSRSRAKTTTETPVPGTEVPVPAGEAAAPGAGPSADVAGAGEAERTDAAGAHEASESAPTAGAGPRSIAAPETEPVNLLEVAGTPVLRRLVPVLVGLLGAGLVLWLVGRRRGR